MTGQSASGNGCEGFSKKWGRNVRGSADNGEGVCGGLEEVGQRCEGLSRKLGRSARVSSGSGTGV